MHLLDRVGHRLNNLALTSYINTLKFFDRSKEKKILFSEVCDWKEEIIKGLKGTKIQAFFKDLETEDFSGYDLVVPLTIADLTSETITQKMRATPSILPSPSIEAVKLFDNKHLFNEKLIGTGFGKYIPNVGEIEGYPYILKKKKDKWGANTFLITDETLEKKHLDKINSDEFFVQEIITGRYEHAAHIVIKNGKIEKALTFKYIFDDRTGIKGKDPHIRNVDRNHYLKIFEEILNATGFEGLCCVNYKVKNGIPYIIEINPRFGGSLAPHFYLFIRGKI